MKVLENSRYKIRLHNNSFELVVNNVKPLLFAPKFTIIYGRDDPQLKMRGEMVDEPSPRARFYAVPTWNHYESGGRTKNFFQAGEVMEVRALPNHAEIKQRKILWTFPETKYFSLKSELTLPGEKEDPQITFYLTPNSYGYFSVGFTGAPEVPPEEIDIMWQPPIWHERRFPLQPYLSPECVCPLPAVLVRAHGVTVGVTADPSEAPFRLPTRRNSRFGVLVRNAKGQAQPMIFAPVFGSPESYMEPGKTYRFSLRLVVKPGEWNDAYRHIVRNIYRFRDLRDNSGVGCSMNQTLENIIDYAMNDRYSYWNMEQKAYSYHTDVPGAFKIVSPLHPLSLAIIADNEEIYKKRALPMIEYVMSRGDLLFDPNIDAKISNPNQIPSHKLNGPCIGVCELAVLYLFSNQRSTVFRRYAEELYETNQLNIENRQRLREALHMFRLTNNPTYLKKAMEEADNYIKNRIENPTTDFSDIDFAWHDVFPMWIELFELYEETGEQRYLDACIKAAKIYETIHNMSPPVPDTTVVVNKGGKATIYWWQKERKLPKPMEVPEEEVPAWLVSAVGLRSECPASHGEGGIFMINDAGYFLRLAHYARDIFFRDLARWAMVGRYANFPGYHINTEYTTVYQKPDYPLRPWEELTYNSFHYNHIWPLIAFIMDYLVSDVFYRSNGQIDFPSRQSISYGYFVNKVYGDRLGTFYGEKGIHLWMPKNLIKIDSVQVNYIAGYGNGKLYLAFMNQSKEDLSFKVKLNPNVIPYDPCRSYKIQVWRENQLVNPTVLEQGEVTVSIAGKGITALAIDGINIEPKFQRKIFDPDIPALSDESFAITEASFGKVVGMIICMGRDLTNVYIYTDALPDKVKLVRLHYRQLDMWNEAVDSNYPFEFSIPLDEKASKFEFYLEVTLTDGKQVQSDVIILKR